MENTRVIIPSALVPLLLEADFYGLTRVRFVREENTLASLGFKDSRDERSFSTSATSLGHLFNAVCWLRAYFNRQPLLAMPELHLDGTPFQMRVWQALRQIPYGKATTYGEIARKIGMPKATQAVGQAVGANPIAVIVPCHRVLGAKGLGGYAYGLDVKCGLLAIEDFYLF